MEHSKEEEAVLRLKVQKTMEALRKKLLGFKAGGAKGRMSRRKRG